jgi:DHA2 family multidrug resistance protein
VARNLGGSIGVSLANTELLQRSQFHQARLMENTIPSSPVFQSTLNQITQYFAHSGSPASAQARAMGYIGKLVSEQATLMAYIDVFYTWSVFAALLIPVVLLLIRRTAPGAGQPVVGH